MNITIEEILSHKLLSSWNKFNYSEKSIAIGCVKLSFFEYFLVYLQLEGAGYSTVKESEAHFKVCAILRNTGTRSSAISVPFKISAKTPKNGKPRKLKFIIKMLWGIRFYCKL